MYYPQEPKESGCMDSLIIMRVIIGMLVIPAALIIGTVLFIILLFIALGESPWLGLAVLLTGAGLIGLVLLWDWKKTSKQLRRDQRRQ